MFHVCEGSKSEAPGESSDESAQSRVSQSWYGRENAYKQEIQEGHKEAERIEEVEDEKLSQETHGEVEFKETL